jgi:hypothetical protein
MSYVINYAITSVSADPNVATFINRPSLNFPGCSACSDHQSELVLIEVETTFLQQEVEVVVP